MRDDQLDLDLSVDDDRPPSGSVERFRVASEGTPQPTDVLNTTVRHVCGTAASLDPLDREEAAHLGRRHVELRTASHRPGDAADHARLIGGRIPWVDCIRRHQPLTAGPLRARARSHRWGGEPAFVVRQIEPLAEEGPGSWASTRAPRALTHELRQPLTVALGACHGGLLRVEERADATTVRMRRTAGGDTSTAPSKHGATAW